MRYNSPLYIWIVISLCLGARAQAQDDSTRLLKMLGERALSELALGVEERKQERFRLTDIRIGYASVKHLFEVEEDEQGLGRFFGVNDEIRIKPKDENALREIRSLLLVRDKTPH